MKKKIDLTGQRFGRLTVIETAQKKRGKDKYWSCRCDCGKIIETTTHRLISGGSRSCGCLQKEIARENGTIHGGSFTRLYSVWRAMKSRCYTVSAGNYQKYGGRGIKICDEWLEFSNFRKWALSNGYNDNLTLDRIDPNGNYCPDNCRWATMREQENNRRNTVFIEFNGETHSLAEWSRLLGIEIETLRCRINRGWTIERALTEPVHK